MYIMAEMYLTGTINFKDNVHLNYIYRSGSKVRNWHLYPMILKELARVSQIGTGRACLLTQDKKCIIKVCLRSYCGYMPVRRIPERRIPFRLPCIKFIVFHKC